MANAAAGPRRLETAEDRYPGKPVWLWHSAFERWFIVGADDPMKRIVRADCAREFTDFKPPTERAGGCPDIATKIALPPGTLQDLRAKDDRREWLQDPAHWPLAEAAREASTTTGHTDRLYDAILRLLGDPATRPPALATLARAVLESLVGPALATRLVERAPDQPPPRGPELPTRPPTTAQADLALSYIEGIYTAATGQPPPATPQLRTPGAGPGAFRLPGFNPTYPTPRGLREPRAERERYAYLYGIARSLYYECAQLTFWADIRQQIPEHFGPLYGRDLDAAEAFLRDLAARKRARFEERNYDLRTCRPGVAPEAPEVPGAPPVDHGAITSYIYACAYQIIGDQPYAATWPGAGTYDGCVQNGGIWIRSPVHADGFIGHWEHAPPGSGGGPE
jgi:hypothetical protein